MHFGYSQSSVIYLRYVTSCKDCRKLITQMSYGFLIMQIARRWSVWDYGDVLLDVLMVFDYDIDGCDCLAVDCRDVLIALSGFIVQPMVVIVYSG